MAGRTGQRGDRPYGTGLKRHRTKEGSHPDFLSLSTGDGCASALEQLLPTM